MNTSCHLTATLTELLLSMMNMSISTVKKYHLQSHRPSMMNFVVFFIFLTMITQLSSPCPVKEAHHRTISIDYDHDSHFDNERKPSQDRQSPGELICDTIGKCGHKVASSIGKARDKITETTQKDIDYKRHIAHKTVDGAHEAVGEIKEIATKKAQDVKDATGAVKDIGKTLAGDISRNTSKQIESLKRNTKKLKLRARQLFDEMSQSARNTVRYLVSTEAFDDFVVILNLVGVASAYGMLMWVTFVSSYVLEGALTRQQFGIVQSRIYPVYFRVLVCCIFTTLLGHVYGHRDGIFTDKGVIYQTFNLIGSILVVFANLLILEPRISKAMCERLKVEKEEGRGVDVNDEGVTVPDRVSDDPTTATNNNNSTRTMASNATTTQEEEPERTTEEEEQEAAVRSRILRNERRIKRLNSFSSILNFLTFMALSWHLVYLSQRLCFPC